MLGAIIGDVVGSIYEFGSDKTKDFPLFVPECHPTDDTILTICVGVALAHWDRRDEKEFQELLIKTIRDIARQYPNAGYGGMFHAWLMSENPAPYGSYSNGSAMRVSPCAIAANSLAEAERLAELSAAITHNHPEGIRGAKAVAAAVYLAKSGEDKDTVRSYIEKMYYDLDFTVDEIRPTYSPALSCEKSVPQAIVCFLDSDGFEDAIRNAISLGGDGDTLAAIAGAVAEAYYGIPPAIAEQVFTFLDDNLSDYFFEYADALY